MQPKSLAQSEQLLSLFYWNPPRTNCAVHAKTLANYLCLMHRYFEGSQHEIHSVPSCKTSYLAFCGCNGINNLATFLLVAGKSLFSLIRIQWRRWFGFWSPKAWTRSLEPVHSFDFFLVAQGRYAIQASKQAWQRDSTEEVRNCDGDCKRCKKVQSHKFKFGERHH